MQVKGVNGINFTSVGENVASYTTDEGMLLLAINTKATLRTSQSGKSDTVATTGGNIPLCGVKVGVNVYRPLDKTVISQRANAEAIASRQAQEDAKVA